MTHLIIAFALPLDEMGHPNIEETADTVTDVVNAQFPVACTSYLVSDEGYLSAFGRMHGISPLDSLKPFFPSAKE